MVLLIHMLHTRPIRFGTSKMCFLCPLLDFLILALDVFKRASGRGDVWISDNNQWWVGTVIRVYVF